MLFDPKWEQQTKADPFTLESLIAWLETRDPADRYDFCKWNECLLGQWLRSIDPSAHVDPGGHTGFYYRAFGQTIDLTKFAQIVHGGSYWKESNLVFGRALERARAALLAE